MTKFKKQNSKNELFEIILPLDPGATGDDDGLFDDCPLCQQLKREIEAGLVKHHGTATWREEE